MQAAAGCSVLGTGREPSIKPSRMPSEAVQSQSGLARSRKTVPMSFRTSSSSVVLTLMQGYSALSRGGEAFAIGHGALQAMEIEVCCKAGDISHGSFGLLFGVRYFEKAGCGGGIGEALFFGGGRPAIDRGRPRGRRLWRGRWPRWQLAWRFRRGPSGALVQG